MTRVRMLTSRLALAGAALACAGTARAQENLLADRTANTGVLVDHWSFGSGIAQRAGGDSIEILGATQFTIPFAVSTPVGSRWTIDAAGAYASGSVNGRGFDTLNTTRTKSVSLSGPTDVTLRGTGSYWDDHLLFTLGVNAPTGKTKLDGEELGALRVLGAPALRFSTPQLGKGFGGIVGVVLAREFRGWAWAFGSSYEMRGTYAPLTFGGIAPDLDPGDAVHLSVGATHVHENRRSELSFITDIYGKDQLTINSSAGNFKSAYQLGPGYTLTWNFLSARPSGGAFGFWLFDHARSPFKGPDGHIVRGSFGNELETGITQLIAMRPSVGFRMGLDGRYHTGMKVDNSIATAAIASGGLTLGIDATHGNWSLAPFVRGQYGRIDSGDDNVTASAISGGLTFGTRF